MINGIKNYPTLKKFSWLAGKKVENEEFYPMIYAREKC